VLGPVLIKVWSENGHDVFIMELLQELFMALAGNPLMAVAFQTRMFPVLVSALEHGDQKAVAFTALDLFAALIKQVPDPLPAVYAQEVFPKVIEIMLVVDDSGLLQV
jgi:hypothetical protein